MSKIDPDAPARFFLTDDQASAGPTEGLPLVQELNSRFLFPFYFARRSIAEAERLLTDLKFTTRRGEASSVWNIVKPQHLYQDELLQHASEFLFGAGNDTACRHLQINPVAAQAWFDSPTVQYLDQFSMTLELIAGQTIELFLSPQGVGVLSIALAPRERNLTTPQALDFNYHLAQFRRHNFARLRKAHPQDDPERWNKIPEDRRAMIAPPPPDTAELNQRLAAAGGSFNLLELVYYLLEPLKPLEFRDIQNELSVYTVARLGSEFDFADLDVRRKVSILLSGLAQVEESRNVGAVPGVVPVAEQVLSRAHWAATGLLGAAHLIRNQSTQEVRIAFDEQRLSVVREKYFVQYMIALLQRLTLNRASDDFSRLCDLTAADSDNKLIELRGNLLDFSARGHFAQTSVRQALHRYYQLARAGLDVPNAWLEVRQAIADMDSVKAASRQERLVNQQMELTSNMDENITEVRQVQTFLHRIEYFIISVYFAHLWHMFAAENHAIGGGGELHDWIVSIGVVVAALLGFRFARLIDGKPLFGGATKSTSHAKHERTG